MRINRYKSGHLLIVVLLIGAVLPGWGQLVTGTITGHITDTTGAVVSGAKVRVVRPDVNLKLETISNQDGIYNFSQLQPGTYDVIAENSGFNTAKTTVTLTVAQTIQVNLALTVGNVSKTVVVEAGSSVELESQNSSLDFLVGSQQIADLPLNGRNPYALAALSPGILPETGGVESFGSGMSSARPAAVAADNANFETNGGLGAFNSILIDGIPVVVCCQGQPAVTPSVEGVDQFRVLTSVPPAEYGATSGGIINIVSKAGTAKLRGDLYEYLRNDQLDAANYFTKLSGKPPIPGRSDFRVPHKFNQFGGILGGPVFIPKVFDGRKSTYFFFGFEGVQAVTTGYTTTTVPTALERQGIFTEAPQPLYDPTHIYPDPTHPGQYVRELLPAANGYPAGRFVSSRSPVALAYLKLFPNPTTSGVINNYSYAPPEHDTDRQYTVRIDHAFSPSQQSFVRFTVDRGDTHTTDLFGHFSGPSSGEQKVNAYLFALDHKWIVSPNLLVNFQYGFPLQSNQSFPGDYYAYNPTDYGYSSNFASEQQVKGLPVISVSGFASIGTTSNILLDHYMHSASGSAILQRGRHTLTFGVDARFLFENEGTLSNPLGSFSFSPSFYNGPNPNASVPTAQSPFDAFAAFLGGFPASGSIIRQETVALTQRYAAAFLQDDWKVIPKLTLNLGVRYEFQTAFKDRHNHWADFNPTAPNPLATQTGLPLIGTAEFLGTSGAPTRMWNTSPADVDPRIGLTFNPIPKTVFRGGYGILHIPVPQMFYRSNSVGFTQTNSYVASVDGYTPAGTISDPFPNGVQLPQGPSAGPTAGMGTALTAIVYKKPVAYEQQWNFGIEQSITSGLILSVNYAGSHGVRLPINGTPNDLQPKNFGAIGDQQQVTYLKGTVANPFYGIPNNGALNTATISRLQLLAAYPQYTSVTEASLTAGSATYNALQSSLTARSKRGATLSVSYIFSKLLGDTNDMIGGVTSTQQFIPYQNYYFKKNERSVMATDTPHRVVAAGSYELPFGRGREIGGAVAPWIDEIIGGWQLNGLVSVESGYPMNITVTGGNAFGGSRPSFVAGQDPLTHGDIHHRLGGTASTQGYFNSAAFRLPQSFELGNVPRFASTLRRPGAFQDDLSAMKHFPLKDSLALEFRLEAFNFLNKVQFSYPGTSFGSSTFGVVSSQANLPRNVQVALKLSW